MRMDRFLIRYFIIKISIKKFNLLSIYYFKLVFILCLIGRTSNFVCGLLYLNTATFHQLHSTSFNELFHLTIVERSKIDVCIPLLSYVSMPIISLLFRAMQTTSTLVSLKRSTNNDS